MEYKTSIKFYLSEKLNKQGSAPIYMRIITDRDKKELLVAKIPPHEWLEAKQRTKSNSEVNLKISDLEHKARRIQIQLEDEERPVTARILKDYLTGKNKIKTFLIEYFDQFVHEKNDNPELSPNTLVLYRQTLEKVREFVQAEIKAKDILLKEVNFKFLDRFQHFLFRQNLKANTVDRHHSRFRTLLHQGRKEGKINLNPYENFSLKKLKSDPKYLTQTELDKLENQELGGDPRLMKVRDIFLFSVYTGLRYQDTQNLKLKNIKKSEGGILFISISQQKTGEILNIPLLEPAKLILEKYDNHERKITGNILPRLSNQKVNEHLKEIAILIGIASYKNLTHHVARHTCATTILLARGVPLEVVSKWLGHTNIKQTLIYARITEEYLGHIAGNLNKQLLNNQYHLNTYANFHLKTQQK